VQASSYGRCSRVRSPSDWKPVATVGIGVKEIRVHAGKEYRVIYVARFSEVVYVIHAFDKKARRTPKSEIDLARTRYRNMLNTRKQK
jgi:phage-related protein